MSHGCFIPIQLVLFTTDLVPEMLCSSSSVKDAKYEAPGTSTNDRTRHDGETGGFHRLEDIEPFR